jgi:hypothetical protein
MHDDADVAQAEADACARAIDHRGVALLGSHGTSLQPVSVAPMRPVAPAIAMRGLWDLDWISLDNVEVGPFFSAGDLFSRGLRPRRRGRS